MAVALAATPAFAVSIELKDVAPDRVERQRAWANGRTPLPNTPDVGQTATRLTEKGMQLGASLLIRIFKSESELELWMEKDGRFELFATYPICHWSGTVGPKQREGDKQTPEGFYTITSRQLHHVGRWPKSLNLGFPNAYDQALNRDGSYILVHGGCSSVGCFAMTNPVISEVYELASAALRGGQRHIQAHVFPFRMTAANLAKNKTSEWSGFWANLSEGYDSFEKTRRPPRVSVCDNRYLFQDDTTTGPLEAGGPSPLAVCGRTAAAIRARDKSALLVPLQTQPAAALSSPEALSPNQNGAAMNPPPSASLASLNVQTVSADLSYELVPNLNPPPLPRTANGRVAGEPLPCDFSLASCRKYAALRNKRGSRLAKLGGGSKGLRTALSAARSAR